MGSVAYYVDGAHGASAASGLEKTITGITKAATAVVTAAGHGFTNGNQVYLAVSGMTEVNGLYFTVANTTTDTFELSGINSSAYTTFTSGTAIEPLKKIITAWGKADATAIYVAPWNYNRDDSLTTGNPGTSADSLVVLPWMIRRGPIISSMRWNHLGTTWANDNGFPNLWTATRSAVASVRDFRHVSKDGEARIYELAVSATACSLTRGSWYLDSSNLLHIHTLDDGPPGDHIAVFLTENACTFTTGKTIYFEGIEFHGGTNCMAATNSGSTGVLLLKDCHFRYAPTGNGLIVQGMEFYHEGCTAKFCGADGFNYRTGGGSVASGAEIRSEGSWNGTARTSSGNGSSMHDAGSIIRINCYHHHNSGPNVVDIGPGSKTWNVGVRAESSLAASEANRSNFFVQGASSEMWNYDCSGSGSPIAFVSDTNAVMYNASRVQVPGTTQQSAGGTVSTYTQA